MRVLITGVAGFAGRHLAELCAAEGDEVVGCGRRPAAEAEAKTEAPAAYLSADLTDAGGARELLTAVQPERVYHLAAIASVARSWEEPASTIRANVEATVNLLEAVRAECPDAAVLVACSGEEYGPPERQPVDESHPLRPQNPYAASKAATDLAAGMYADAHGMRVVRTRAFNHAGPGQEDAYVVSAFARQIAEAESRGEREVTVMTGTLATRRDFSDVRDVVRAYRLALDACEPGAYNVCSGHATATADILAGLARHARLDVQQRTDPRRVRSHEVMEINGSHEKLSRCTDWRPEIPLDRTLRDALDWWRERIGA